MYLTENIHCGKILQSMTGQTLPQHEGHKCDLGNLCANNNGFCPQMKIDHPHCMFATKIYTLGDC